MRYFIFTIVALSILAHGASCQEKNIEFDGARVDNHFDMFFTLPVAAEFDRSTFIYFGGDYCIVQQPVEKIISERRKIDGKDSLVRKKSLTYYRSFITRKNQKFGLVYDSLQAVKARAKYPVDSLINDELVFPKHFYPLIDSVARLVKSTKDLSSGDVIERFEIINPKPGKPDSLYYYYSTAPIAIPLINPAIKNSNLFLWKFEAIMAAKVVDVPSYKGPVPRKKWSIEINKIIIQNKAELLQFIQKFNRDEEKYLKQHSN